MCLQITWRVVLPANVRVWFGYPFRRSVWWSFERRNQQICDMEQEHCSVFMQSASHGNTGWETWNMLEMNEIGECGQMKCGISLCWQYCINEMLSLHLLTIRSEEIWKFLRALVKQFMPRKYYDSTRARDNDVLKSFKSVICRVIWILGDIRKLLVTRFSVVSQFNVFQCYISVEFNLVVNECEANQIERTTSAKAHMNYVASARCV